MRNLFLLLLLGAGLFVRAQTGVQNVDAATFKKMADEKKGVLIDLRTSDEIARKGMIKGARQIDFLGQDAEKEIAALDKKKTYLIYCAGGGRSGDCAALMEKMGFTQVVNLEKGFEAWRKAGFAIEKK